MVELSYQPLSPMSFLARAAGSHPDQIAVVDGDMRLTYRQLQDRCQRLAGALDAVAQQRPVAVLAPNSHLLLEAHFGVPWAGVPLVAINTRLGVDEVAYIVSHCEAAVLVYQAEFEATAHAVARRLPGVRLVRGGGRHDEYEEALAAADRLTRWPADERSLLSINYTSGTTGRPKGVMYHHRGAYLQALAMVVHAGLTMSSVHLWTLPMFHCNGWCFPWAVTAVAARHVCMRRFDAGEAWRTIEQEKVTHFEAAPTVLSMMAAAPEAVRRQARPPVHVCTGGAPPSPTILERMSVLGVDVTHLYGLTETFGPSVVCEWRPEWEGLSAAEHARLKARQGTGNIVSERIRVVSSEDGSDVPADGRSVGEIALRGNNVMLGYFKDPEATAAAAPGGWFRTGDLGVRHPDGYVEIRDRIKDVIISGGENIASVEVEQAIVAHPAVLEAAVVAARDDRWGEVPVAYVTLQSGAAATEDEIIEHVRTRLARFKAPHRVIFTELPKTSTGKIQKFVLRERVRQEQAEGVR